MMHLFSQTANAELPPMSRISLLQTSGTTPAEALEAEVNLANAAPMCKGLKQRAER
jgi:hypothetical protein